MAHGYCHQVDEFLGINAVQRCAQDLIIFDIDDEFGYPFRRAHDFLARHDGNIGDLFKPHLRGVPAGGSVIFGVLDRKSTRLNSSHLA